MHSSKHHSYSRKHLFRLNMYTTHDKVKQNIEQKNYRILFKLVIKQNKVSQKQLCNAQAKTACSR